MAEAAAHVAAIAQAIKASGASYKGLAFFTKSRDPLPLPGVLWHPPA